LLGILSCTREIPARAVAGTTQDSNDAKLAGDITTLDVYLMRATAATS
jgi:hypothetical protein